MSDPTTPEQPAAAASPPDQPKKLWPCLVGGPLVAALLCWAPGADSFWGIVTAAWAVLGAVAGLFATLLMWSPPLTMFVLVSTFLTTLCVLIKTDGEVRNASMVGVACLASAFLVIVILMDSSLDGRQRLESLGGPGSSAVTYFDSMSIAQVRAVAQENKTTRVWAEGTKTVMGAQAADWSERDSRQVAHLAYNFGPSLSMSRGFSHATCRRIQQNYQTGGKALTDRYTLTINGKAVPTTPSPNLCPFWGFTAVKLAFRDI